MKRFILFLCLTALILCGCGGQTPPEPDGTAFITVPCNGFLLCNGAGEELYMGEKGGSEGSMTVEEEHLIVGSPAELALYTPNIPPYTAKFDDPADASNALFVSAPGYCFSAHGEGIETITVDRGGAVVTGGQMSLSIMAVCGSGPDYLWIYTDASDRLEATMKDGLLSISGAEGYCTLKLDGYSAGALSGQIGFTASGGDIWVNVFDLTGKGQADVVFDDGTRIPWVLGPDP